MDFLTLEIDVEDANRLVEEGDGQLAGREGGVSWASPRPAGLFGLLGEAGLSGLWRGPAWRHPFKRHGADTWPTG